MDAVKKVIANMTLGKDVSMLFSDVVNCIQTGNIELKKLVYLYLINYAKTNPDMALRVPTAPKPRERERERERKQGRRGLPFCLPPNKKRARRTHTHTHYEWREKTKRA